MYSHSLLYEAEMAEYTAHPWTILSDMTKNKLILTQSAPR